MSSMSVSVIILSIISNIIGFWLIFIRRKKSILALIAMAVSGFTTSIIFLAELYSVFLIYLYIGYWGIIAIAFTALLPILTWNYLWHIDNNQ